MTNLIMSLAISIASLGFVFGLFLFFKPAAMIEIQRKFYTKINWRVEPISMNMELRNTKIMGLCLAVMVLLATIFIMC